VVMVRQENGSMGQPLTDGWSTITCPEGCQECMQARERNPRSQRSTTSSCASSSSSTRYVKDTSSKPLLLELAWVRRKESEAGKLKSQSLRMLKFFVPPPTTALCSAQAVGNGVAKEEIYAHFDKDYSGDVSAEEFKEGLKNLGIFLTDAELMALMVRCGLSLCVRLCVCLFV